MSTISQTELQKRLRSLEVKPIASTALVKKVGDQYEYDKDFIYIAYASALANLSVGAIANQSDATDFQLTPYNDSGVLLAFRGYLLNKSIYQSGDPTDYIWESTSGEAGFTSSERYHTTSTGLQESLGNPTKPGTNITWTVINAGTAVPSTAVYVAERFTITTTAGAVTSEWKIKTVGKHVDDTVIKTGGITTATIASNAITSAKVTAGAIVVEKINLNGTLSVTANSGAITWGKSGATDTTNTGLFLGRDGSGNPRIVFGNASSFINFDGTDVSLVNCDVDNNAGTGAVIITNTSNTTQYSIGPNIATINIQLSGGGGGGGGGQGDYGTSGSAGGTSSIVVKKADGSTRTGNGALTITAAGGAGGQQGGVGGNTGSAGGSFSHASATEPPFVDAAGGAGSHHVGNPNASRPRASNGAIPSAGGGGDGRAGGQNSGAGGAVGAYNSVTYTVVDTTDSLLVTVGAGGAGDSAFVNTPGDDGGGGTGARGVVRIQGAQ